MKRIAIIGSTGSGKSTLAKRLGLALDLPVVELDALHWLPGWVEREREEFFRLVEQATAPPRWVIDGGYSTVRDIIWARADTLIWIDLPYFTTFWQLLKRTVNRARSRAPICNGNYESWRLSFASRDSILLWFLRSYPDKQRRYPALLREFEEKGTDVVVLKSRTEIDAFVARLTPER
jgi:adenylate kinase family enzyme